MDEMVLKHQIALTLLPGIGPVTGKKLVSYCGGVDNIFKDGMKEVKKIPGMALYAGNLSSKRAIMQRAEEEVSFVLKNNIKPLFYQDPDYPVRLKQCVDSPLLIYLKGNQDLNKSKLLAVVGTRKPTDYGQELCKTIIEELKDLDLVIVSGLAYGIDSIAHKTALDSGLESVAVLAHGLHTIYPSQNRHIALEMTQRGGLITEFLNGVKPDKENFPKRNRIVAGLCDAVLVVESAEKGGALITADIANSYNRDVFAVPGKVKDNYSMGCNYLIFSNRAALVRSGNDIKYFMDWEPSSSVPGKQQKLFRNLTPDEKLVMETLKQHGKLNIDQLSGLARIGLSRLSAVLLDLEFEGMIKALPGKIYKWL